MFTRKILSMKSSPYHVFYNRHADKTPFREGGSAVSRETRWPATVRSVLLGCKARRWCVKKVETHGDASLPFPIFTKFSLLHRCLEDVDDLLQGGGAGVGQLAGV